MYLVMYCYNVLVLFIGGLPHPKGMVQEPLPKVRLLKDG